MNILDEIVQKKREYLEGRLSEAPLEAFAEQSRYYDRQTRSLKSSLRSKRSGVIAEFKRRSPSKGDIALSADIKDIVQRYQKAGASGVSILTDGPYFGGSDGDVQEVREYCDLPILRKDFMIDPYQIHEAKAIGADVVLLIARILEREQIVEFTELAHSLGLEVLLEVHSRKEYEEKYIADVDVLGVNNRDLDTLTIDTELSHQLLSEFPADQVKVSESGLRDPAVAAKLIDAGYDGLLIGEHFMVSGDPAHACEAFINAVEGNQ